jgi:abortive infection bacteriophage resistance protein
MTLRLPADKAPTTIEQQIALLKSRGLLIDDEAQAARFLSHLNYYRLRGYWFAFMESTDRFKPGTRFSDIIALYDFDRHLRLLILDAIERFEVSLRTQWAYVLGHAAGQSAHRNAEIFSSQHGKLIAEVDALYNDRKERFLARYLNKGEEPPIWALCEAFSLGDLSKWLTAVKSHELREQISKCYVIKEKAFCSFVRHLTIVRNLCAHHSRLWDKPLEVNKLSLPKTPAQLTVQLQSAPEHLYKIYNTLVILAWIMKTISPESNWAVRVRCLLEGMPQHWAEMGVPNEWQNFPLWQEAAP